MGAGHLARNTQTGWGAPQLGPTSPREAGASLGPRQQEMQLKRKGTDGGRLQTRLCPPPPSTRRNVWGCGTMGRVFNHPPGVRQGTPVPLHGVGTGVTRPLPPPRLSQGATFPTRDWGGLVSAPGELRMTPHSRGTGINAGLNSSPSCLLSPGGCGESRRQELPPTAAGARS